MKVFLKVCLKHKRSNKDDSKSKKRNIFDTM